MERLRSRGAVFLIINNRKKSQLYVDSEGLI